MPLYLTRFSYTPETWARLIDNPEDRREAAQSRRARSVPASALALRDLGAYANARRLRT